MEQEQLPSEPLRCQQCGDVIGVYERLVHVSDGAAIETSRAAAPHLSRSRGGTSYHAGCYEPRSASGPATP